MPFFFRMRDTHVELIKGVLKGGTLVVGGTSSLC